MSKENTSLDPKKSLNNPHLMVSQISDAELKAISYFGLQHGRNLARFMLSPAGKTIKTEVDKILTQQELLQEYRKALQKDQHIKKKLKAFIHAKKKNKKNMVTAALVLEEPVEKLKDQSRLVLKNEAFTSIELTRLDYYEYILKQSQKASEELLLIEQTLNQELNNYLALRYAAQEKHEFYEKKLGEWAQSWSDYEQLSSLDLEKCIDELIHEIALFGDKITKQLDKDTEKHIPRMLSEHHLMSLKLASLQQIQSKQRFQHYFVDEQGEPVDSYQKATFLLKMDKKIVIQDGVYYLLPKHAELRHLNTREKDRARDDFEKTRPTLMCVPKAVRRYKQLELDQHDAHIAKLQSRLNENSMAQLIINNQIRQCQSFLAQLRHGEEPLAAPSSSLNTMLKLSIPQPSAAVAAFFSTPQFKMVQASPNLTSQSLFSLAKNIMPKQAEEIKRFLMLVMKTHGLSNIPSTTPIPPIIMRSLLENMSRFAINPYKPNVTKEPHHGSNFQAKEIEQSFHPTPFHTNPFR